MSWAASSARWAPPDRTPRAGDRAPDAGGLQHAGRLVRLHEVFAGDTVHHLLVLPPTGEPDQRSGDLVDALAHRYGAMLRPLRVTDQPTGRHDVRDLAGELTTRYRRDRLYLVRPDGYLAFRGTLADAGALQSYPERVFDAPAHDAPDVNELVPSRSGPAG